MPFVLPDVHCTRNCGLIVHLFNGLKGLGVSLLSGLGQRLLMETPLPWHATRQITTKVSSPLFCVKWHLLYYWLKALFFLITSHASGGSNRIGPVYPSVCLFVNALKLIKCSCVYPPVVTVAWCSNWVVDYRTHEVRQRWGVFSLIFSFFQQIMSCHSHNMTHKNMLWKITLLFIWESHIVHITGIIISLSEWESHSQFT